MSHPGTNGTRFITALAIALPLASLGLSAPSAAGGHGSHGPWAAKPPKDILISLDGAKPDFIQKYLRTGVLPWHGGLIAAALRNAQDTNPTFNYSLPGKRIFGVVETRPLNCAAGVGLCTNAIGQDSGDVFAMLAEGYNFDGIQNPGVARRGDPAFSSTTTVLSFPNFYGAQGHDPRLASMSATFIAAGPHIGRGTVWRVSNIDVAPTIMRILGVRPASTVDGRVLREILD